MLTRRTATTIIGAAILLAAPPGPVRNAWAQTNEQAVTFIKSTSDRLVAVVNAGGSADDKRHRLQQVIDQTVDVDDIARFCLGRFWRTATPDQQKQYMLLFRTLMVIQIAGHLGEYQGVQVTMGAARTSADTEIVITTVARPNNPTTQVDWVVSSASGGPKVVDLLAGGTSMRQTQSADFAAYLAHHQYSIHDLIDGMRLQVAQSSAE
jgi:phospholipid transport system substrate-binding protein